MRPILDPEKLAKLKTADQWLDEEYGKHGTPAREALRESAYNWYYTELLKEKRKKLHITQRQLAERVGKRREYISLLEKGKTDMQLSTFLNISQALGMKLQIA